ncbi:DUF6199 family natural product biosynthesis protein [Nocardiopsis tropica]|uniref:DUF6199 domain-containing protein n=1 Tax=Nocardiopsis tropica TaxID=109330 RepID=A0ABU7KUF6_9ACTN|nr:DUF6199 family natural product biosynthesis protein [Nocardiopsis umidischolae]MEE2052943.1 hypothetical protein [Nocardiopsis umidischolae]
MIPLLLLLLVFMAGAVAVLINPRLVWRMNSWQYRNPEYNEPSDAAYTGYRIGAVVMMFAIVVMLGAVWEPQRQDSPQAAGAPEPTPSPTPASRQEVTATVSDAGRIRAYSVSGETALTVHIYLGECTSGHVPASAREEDETVTISFAVGVDDVWCDPERDSLIEHTTELDEPLGGREVVDTDGEPIPPCGEEEQRRCP